MRTLVKLLALIWIVWGSLSAGSTIFLWLSSWDVTAAYGVSLLGMVPLIGPVVASLIAPEVWEMSLPFALGEFAGGYALLAVALILDRGAREREAQAAAKAGDTSDPA